MGNAGLTFKLFGEDVSASSALEKVGGKGKDIAGAIGAAFAGVKIGEAIAANFDNEPILRRFKAGLGQTPEIAKQAGDLAGQLYREGMGGSLEEVLAAVSAVGTDLVDLGNTSPADISKITKAAQGVADVMGVDVTEVTSAAGNMFKNGLAPSAQAALDIIATGATNGANRSGDLLDTFREYGASFADVGIDGQTALMMIKGAMDGGAFSTDIAADSVREFGTRITDMSDETGAALGHMGLDAATVQKTLAEGGPAAQEMTQKIIYALGEMTDPLQQQKDGAALFGSMWEDGGKKLVLSMDQSDTAITDMAGAATDLADEAGPNASKVEIFKRGMDGVLQSATELPGAMGDVVAGVMAFGPTALAAGSAAVSAIGWLREMGVVSKITAAAQWLLNAAMSANPIMLVVLAVAALVAGFVWLWNNVDGFREFWIGIWDKIQEVVAVVADWFVSRWDAVTSWLSEKWNAFAGFFSTLWDRMKAAVESIVGNLRTMWDALVSWLSGLWNGFTGFFTGLWERVKAIVSGAVESVRTAWASSIQWVSDKWSGFTDFIRGIVGKITGFFSGLWDGLRGGVSNVISWFQGIFRGAVDGITGIFSSIGDVIGRAAGKVGDVFKAPINWAIDGINWIIRQLNRIKFDVPDWVPGIGGRTVGVNLREIPHLASGGIVMDQPGGQLIVAGDGREPEVVAPLSQLGNLGGGGDIHIHMGQGVIFGSASELAQKLADIVATERRRGTIRPGAFA